LPERRATPHLAKYFVVGSGKDPLAGADPRFGVLLRDLDLTTLATLAGGATDRLAVDIESVSGLNADDAGATFVVERLGIGIVITRRPALAALVAEAGGLGLVQVLAFDSTGLGRSLENHVERPGVGTVVSPGPVLSHFTVQEIARLPRPIMADGLIDTPDRARRIFGLADSVVLDLEVARVVAAGLEDWL